MTNPQTFSKSIEVFFSYSHKDEEMRDELEKHLSILKHRGLISAWHDRKIDAGEEWMGEIDEHLNSAQIILLLISSDFLASKYCYDIEMKRAMERHESKEARVIPIILRHVHWRGSPFSKLQALPTNAEPIQGGNWRSVDEAFSDVAEGLESAIDKLKVANDNSDAGITSKNNGLKTIVVDPWCRGDFATISEAISAATPGSRILIHSGVYDEGLIIDKPLEIVGDGKLGDVIVRAMGKSAVFFMATIGKISNLMLKQNADNAFSCVNIAQGCLELVDCDITSDSFACVAVHGNAYPKIIKTKIHDGNAGGILVYENGQGVIEDNEIYGNASSGVAITDGGNPTLKHNRIHDGKDDGILVSGNGRGVIEDNEIYGNASSGVAITDGGNPTLKHNKIHDGKFVGIFVSGNGLGVIENNEIYCNSNDGIFISGTSCPTIKHNIIRDGKYRGVAILSNRQVIIEDNDIYGNDSRGIDIYDDGAPLVRFNRINKNRSWAIWISEKSTGIIEDNDLRNNLLSGLGFSKESNLMFTRARNLEK